MDNADGTLSIFTTMLPHGAPTAPPPAGRGDAFTPSQLASISRAVAWIRRSGGPRPPGAGGPMRNVELVVRDPRAQR